MKFAGYFFILLVVGDVARAFPPAPHHVVYGIVRDEQGHPLSEGASVALVGSSGQTLLDGVIDPTIAPGVNYSLKVPMDAGTLAQLYQSTAMRPAMPFTAKVTIGELDYVPIEVQGGMLQIGEPGGRTRLDLTLGVDSDGDGLPDAWENGVIAAVDGAESLGDIDPEGDSDGDGVSNYAEYVAGTYAFDERAVFRLDIVEVAEGLARLRFLAVKGRSYRITSSTDGETFDAVEFTLSPDGGEWRKLLSADSIRFQDVFVPAELAGRRVFKLSVY